MKRKAKNEAAFKAAGKKLRAVFSVLPLGLWVNDGNCHCDFEFDHRQIENVTCTHQGIIRSELNGDETTSLSCV